MVLPADLPEPLIHELSHLGNEVGILDDVLVTDLQQLVAAMWAAIPTYRGMTLTVVTEQQTVHLAAFQASDGAAIQTSIRLPFAVLVPGLPRSSRLVFYAATPGAFVDLAADLGHVLELPYVAALTGGADGHELQIVVDADLPPRSLISGLTGSAEASAVNRAIGVLIDQGHAPDQAQALLHGQAEAAGLPPHEHAARLLGR